MTRRAAPARAQARRLRHFGAADLRAAAREAARLLAPGAHPPEPIRLGHNAVYRLRTPRGLRVLRLSPRAWRSRRELLGELDFIEHLARRGVAVGRPVAGPDGRRVVPLRHGLHACQFRWLPGECVERLDLGPGAQRLASWGALVGRLDRAALGHVALPGRARPHWTRDPLAGCPEQAIGADEPELLRARRELVAWARALPEEPGAFGCVHGDASLVNVMFRGSQAALFDFDDGCRHHFAWEIACALHPHRHRPDFRAVAGGFLEAYARSQPLPDRLADDLAHWMRLRTLAVLLYFRSRRRPGDPWVARATREVLRPAATRA